jgi:hypothetical protein
MGAIVVLTIEPCTRRGAHMPSNADMPLHSGGRVPVMRLPSSHLHEAEAQGPLRDHALIVWLLLPQLVTCAVASTAHWDTYTFQMVQRHVPLTTVDTLQRYAHTCSSSALLLAIDWQIT